MADNKLGKHLRLALREVLKARDMIAVSALRSALASIDNARAGMSARPAGSGARHAC